MSRVAFTISIFVLIASCGSKDNKLSNEYEMYDIGYDDGYATGYNTTCEIRATLINDYDNRSYKEGYSDGYSVGAAECRSSRR